MYLSHFVFNFLYMFQVPKIIHSFFPALIWNIPNAGNKIFLTFDDGPDPEATPRVLDILAEHDAKATFFCLGRQVEKHPAIFDRIKKEGHAVGNHTYSHLSGWTTSNKRYFADITRADEIIGSKLFRPPYGRIRPSQIRILKKNYKIVMWDVMSGDYDVKQKPKQIEKRVQKLCRPGSVVVWHDTIKAAPKLKIILPNILTSGMEKMEFISVKKQ